MDASARPTRNVREIGHPFEDARATLEFERSSPQMTVQLPASGSTIHSEPSVVQSKVAPGASTTTRSELYVHPALVGEMSTR